jgi:predicted RNA binding protein YcfA (HicA-like mRNA interferase family)
MDSKHRKTLQAVCDDPVRSNIPWTEVETMLAAAGAEISEGRGSRVQVNRNGVDAVFHCPHPQKEMDKGALKSMRRFLKEAGIRP